MVRTRLRQVRRRLWTKYLAPFVFVHINKTGGSSIEDALGLSFRHLTALELRAEMGARRWQRRFVFSFVRNPWDKVVSHYYYRLQTEQLGADPPSFNDWVRATYGDQNPEWLDSRRMFLPQMAWLADAHGELMVDFVGRFERLQLDFDEVCARIGRERIALPHLKGSRRPHHRELYQPDTRQIVGEWFAADIGSFGYSF